MKLNNLQAVVDYVNGGIPNHGPWLVHHLRRQASILELSSAIGLDIPGHWLPFLAEGRKVSEVQAAQRLAWDRKIISGTREMEDLLHEVFSNWDDLEREYALDHEE